MSPRRKNRIFPIGRGATLFSRVYTLIRYLWHCSAYLQARSQGTSWQKATNITMNWPNMESRAFPVWLMLRAPNFGSNRFRTGKASFSASLPSSFYRSGSEKKVRQNLKRLEVRTAKPADKKLETLHIRPPNLPRTAAVASYGSPVKFFDEKSRKIEKSG